MRRILLAISVFAGLANAGTLYLPAYPAAVLVFDEAKGQIVDRIPLVTGTPMFIRLSSDKKSIYVTTIDHNGIEVIDVASRKVTKHFELNTPTRQLRFWGGAPDPAGKYFYTVTKQIDQKPDHYEVGKPMYTVIDMDQEKVVKTVEVPSETALSRGFDYDGAAFRISPDGKYLYHFGEAVTVLQSADFKQIDKLDLANPEYAGMQNIRVGGGFGPDLDLANDPGEHVALFNSEDPIVHNKVFGLAHFNLSTRLMDFSPIGPAPPAMEGFQVTPDKKLAYTVAITGSHGTKHCEFWAFDLGSDQVTKKAEVACRTRFTLGISTNGKKLYIYGAGFEIEVYDAATLKYEKTYDLKTDVTYGGIVELP